MDLFYRSLGLDPGVAGIAVVITAARALHPLLRANPDLRLSRRRLYREMLNEHDAARERQSSHRLQAGGRNPQPSN